MDGRRVERRAPRRNPLYVMFLCLVAAVFVLLIVVIVLGAKLGAANKAAEAAEAQIEELQARIESLEDQKEELPEPSLGGEDDKLDGEDMPAIDPGTVTQPTQPTQPTQQENKKVTVDWLDLTGHRELTVLPEKLFSDYAVYYATDGVNLRGGPSTSHAKVQLVEKGEKVKAAAKDGEWTFVSVGSKFGWIKSEYLATTPPSEATAGSLRTN